MLEQRDKKLLLLDLKVNSSNLQRMFFRLRTDSYNTFETSAIHSCLKYQFQLEEKIMKNLGLDFSKFHSEEHINILEKQ
jgi:hemerythrin